MTQKNPEQNHIVTAGVDVGSTMTKAAVMLGGHLAGSAISPTGADHRQAAQRTLDEALRAADIPREEVRYVVGTGYGRVNVPFANRQLTEITCHARCMAGLFPGIGTVIEIGGQDSKAIRLNASGKVEDFVMNDKCAAGTGRFLQVVAGTMDISLAEMNRLALGAQREIPINSFCAVMTQQEIIALMSKDCPPDEILSGLFSGFARRIIKMASKIGIEGEVALTGGGSRHAAFRAAIERELGHPVHMPEEPFLTGAIGAAMLAGERYRKKLQKL